MRQGKEQQIYTDIEYVWGDKSKFNIFHLRNLSTVNFQYESVGLELDE